ncbi:ethanolamine ammonia-lyase subunit EutC [Thiosocius teredinicola]|uniref:ethanolamine ammonia-lyase subunit EutC n=1 Tax=Thiosocius teredinicola TaxID=1973002 RepID=UPI000990D610
MSGKDDTKLNDEPIVVENPWERLRQFTDARIGLGRAGISVPTSHSLAFQLAHAQAQDAVHTPLDFNALLAALNEREWNRFGAPLHLKSRAVDRATYLQRPDYGRRLDDESVSRLAGKQPPSQLRHDLAIVIADGLSAFAIAEHAVAFLDALVPLLANDSDAPWRLAPITCVEQGRVAVGDHVGELLDARCVLVMIGERPGLSSPDSMGLYLTWNPKVGCKDANRNCISNIRPAGLKLSEAASRAAYLLREARTRQLSGVQLKDRSDDSALAQTNNSNFLIE